MIDLTLRCPTCGYRADICFEHGDDWKKGSSRASYDWRSELTMPDDTTQTLVDVLFALRSNNLQQQAAFVAWLADSWYDAKQELAEHQAENSHAQSEAT